MKQERTGSVEETYALALTWLDELVRAHCVYLKGDLGSGKTTFAQGVGRALGIDRSLRSPTFTLVNVYEGIDHPKVARLVHADLYRLENIDEPAWRELGLQEYIDDPETLVLIEWPERLLMQVSGETIQFIADGEEHRIWWVG